MRKLTLQIAVAIILFSGIVNFNTHWNTEFNEQRTYVNPTKSVKYFSLGYQDVMADSFWLRVIQDYGMCEHGRRKEQGAEDQARIGKDRVRDCKKGWVFRMLDVITDLAPKFRMPQATGGLMLSVIVDDIQGASVIFDKAVRNFPDDWSILYRAAYHALYEEENNEKAAGLFRRAAEHGAPFWVTSLSAKLYAKSDRAAFAIKVLKDYMEKYKDSLTEVQMDRLKNRLKELSVQVRNQ